MFTNWQVGIIYILLVSLMWTAGGIVTQYVYSSLHFHAPFFVCYISSILYTVFLPIWFVLRKTNSVRNVMWDNRTEKSLCANRSVCHRDIIRLAVVSSLIWFVSNCLYEYSLLWTSIASSIIINNLSGIFTMLFSWWYGIENLRIEKCIGTLFCLLGVILIAYHDSDKSNSSVSAQYIMLGDLLSFISAIGYGGFATYLRYCCDQDADFPIQLLLGYMGTWSIAIFTPCVILLLILCPICFLNIDARVIGILAVLGLGNYVLSDFLYSKAIILTSPTVANVGLSISIPMAYISDVYINGKSEVSTGLILGSVSVFIGFILLNIRQDVVETPVQEEEGIPDNRSYELVRSTVDNPINSVI